MNYPRKLGEQNSTRTIYGTLELRAKASTSYKTTLFIFLVYSPLLFAQHQATMCWIPKSSQYTASSLQLVGKPLLCGITSDPGGSWCVGEWEGELEAWSNSWVAASWSWSCLLALLCSCEKRHFHPHPPPSRRRTLCNLSVTSLLPRLHLTAGKINTWYPLRGTHYFHSENCHLWNSALLWFCIYTR